MRHPLSLLTREVAPVPLEVGRTALLLQDLHAPFADVADGRLLALARRKVVAREFDEYAAAVPEAVANAGRLLAAAREAGLRVHHVCWGHRGGGGPSRGWGTSGGGGPSGGWGPSGGGGPSPLQASMGWDWDLDGPDGRFPDAVEPRPGEAVHAKPGWGALGAASLATALADEGIASLLLAGLPFDFGIRHTCLELADAGYRVLLASDATAPLTLAAHGPAAGNLAHGATKLRSTAEVLDLLARMPAEGCVWV